MARTHSLQKEKRMELWRESRWQRQEESSKEMESEPKQRRCGAKPVSETKQLQYLCLNSTMITPWVHFVVSMLSEVSHVSIFGGGGLDLCWTNLKPSFIKCSPASCVFGQSGKVLFLSKTENRASHFLTQSAHNRWQCFLLEPRVCLVPSKFVKPLSFQLFCERKIIIHLSAVTGCWKT